MPLFWLSLAFIAGVILSKQVTLSTSWWLLAAGLSLISLALRPIISTLRTHLSSRPQIAFIRFQLKPEIGWPVPAALLLAAFALGGARLRMIQPDFDDPAFIAHYNDQEVIFILEGILIEPPDWRDTHTNLRLRVTYRAGEEGWPVPVYGLILARVAPGGDWRYGDRLRLQGHLSTPPQAEDFSYRDYLAQQGVYTLMEWPRVKSLQRGQGNPFLAALYTLKEWALHLTYRLFPDPEASLLAGILLGEDNGIPEQTAQAFRDTGTAHIIAISGFNITLLAGLFAVVFSRWLGRWRGTLIAGLAIASYTLLVGASASVVRAAIMGSLSLLGRQIGRRQQGLNTLAFVAGLMSLVNPHVLWDVGFQLSFAATLGLILYATPLQEAFVRLAGHFLPASHLERLAGWVGEYLLFTLAAQITSLPVTIYYFQRLSLSSLIANPLILPAQPAVMVLGGLALILGLIYFPLGQAAAYAAWPFVVYTVRLVEQLGKIPGGALALGEVELPWLLLYYALLFALTLGVARQSKWVRALKPSVGLGLLGVLSVLVWRLAWSAPDGRLHLTLLDVSRNGQSGEALLVQTPTGRFVLINGGPSPSALSQALGRRLPLGERRLDFLIIANPDETHVAALPPLLERFPPSQVLWAGSPQASRAARNLQSALQTARIQPITAQGGQVLDLGDGARLRVLSSDKRGATLLLEWHSFRALLPLGLDVDSLEALQKHVDLASVSALLLADGGYAPLNPKALVDKLRPQAILLSVATGDRRGLPSPETLQATAGFPLLRTDQNGWIHLTTDGTQVWVEVERR